MSKTNLITQVDSYVIIIRACHELHEIERINKKKGIAEFLKFFEEGRGKKKVERKSNTIDFT